MASERGKSLQRVESALPSAPLASIRELRAKMREFAEVANVLTPTALVDHIMPLHRVSFAAVVIDPTVDKDGTGAEVYRDRRFCADDERALGKLGIQKLMRAAGIQTVRRTRLDDRSDPGYCEIEIEIEFQDFDGRKQRLIAAKELDLRDGSPATLKPEWRQDNGRNVKTGNLVGLDPTAIADKRRHIAQLCETMALERAGRAALGLKQKYTVAELEKPFVIPRLVPDLDPTNPRHEAALIESALGIKSQLYGGPAGSAAAPPEDVPPAERVIDVEPEPWEVGPDVDAETQGARVAPMAVPPEALAEADATRVRYLQRIDKLLSDLVIAHGPEEADHLSAEIRTGVDWRTADVSTLENVGRGLVALLKGGKR